MDQALTQMIEEPEEQAAGERQEEAMRFEKFKRQNEEEAFKDRQLPDQEQHVLRANYSYLDKKYKSLLQKHKMLEGAFKDVKSVTFEEYISAEADKVAQNEIEAIQKETENRIEALQSKIKELLSESAPAEENNTSLSNVISTKVEEVGKLEALVSTLTMDTERSSAKIQELETTKDALDKALQENMQSLSVKAKELGEVQFQYSTEKKRSEDELCAFRKQIEMLNGKLQKEKRERTTLCLKIKSVENTNLSLRRTISTKVKEIGKLEARISTLTMDAKKSTDKIQELKGNRYALDKALKKSTQALGARVLEWNIVQLRYNTEKKRLEDELCAFKKANEMLNEKLQKAEKENEAKRKEGEEIKGKEEEEKVRSSVQPRKNTQWWGISSAVFTPFIYSRSIYKYRVKAGGCPYGANALDISKYNVLAVAYDYYSVYLYSETNKREEKLCTCQYVVRCLAWNQQGTLLAIGGENNNNTNKTIQVWDIPNRKSLKG